MEKQTTIQAVLTAAFTALTYYVGQLSIPIIVLAVVMVIDYITGMVSAWHNSELSSKKGLFGIVKKLCYLALVCVGMGVDWLIYSGMVQIGITTNYTIFFGILVAIWLIINELISILENLNRIGVPLPKFITSVVKKLKNTVEKSVDESEE